jgi:hypothetical protein
MTGSQGSTGMTGSQGSIGMTGSQGSTGMTGSQGSTGMTGSQGSAGVTGFAPSPFTSVASLKRFPALPASLVCYLGCRMTIRFNPFHR